jgi:hypothetical protein
LKLKIKRIQIKTRLKLDFEAKLKLKVPSALAALVGVVAMFYLAAPLGVVLRPDFTPLGVVL